MPGRPDYYQLVDFYEEQLRLHGDCSQGVGWKDSRSNRVRFSVMLEMLTFAGAGSCSILDFGCGLGHFYEYLQEVGRDDIAYFGVDLSDNFIDIAREKHPNVDFFCTDIFNSPKLPIIADFIIANGVFTQKRGISDSTMDRFFVDAITTLFGNARRGVAVNVMSPVVDWRRDGNFHLPLSRVEEIASTLSNRFLIRHDYGLHEYTLYLFKPDSVA